MNRRAAAPTRGVLPVMVVLLLALALGVGLFFGVGGVRQYAANRSYHPIVVPSPTAPSPAIAEVTAAAAGTPSAAPGPPAGAAPTPSGVASVLSAPLSDSGLGPAVSAQVFDASSGTQLFARNPGATVAPASTAKLLTAAALLSVRQATDRFTTRVVRGAQPATVVLVGGGDPTLSAAPIGRSTAYDDAARIATLATQVRAALAGARVDRVLVDDSLFTGPTVAPGWAAEDAPSSYASPITAAMVDGGRDDPAAAERSAAPDLAAGNALAHALGGASVARGSAPAGAAVLGTVRSAPVERLVEEMLSESDNVLAEVLGRQVALAVGRPASFAGAAAGIAQVAATLGITVGPGMKDGSGLSALDRLPAAALSQTLLAATRSERPRLRPIVAGLSVAGWEGSLVEQDRFTGTAARADGAVRAKTGSLTGVSAIAGLAADADGRLLVFSFVADAVPGGSPDSPVARAAFDRAISGLVACGCH